MTNEELQQAIVTVMVFDGWREISNQKSRYLRPHGFNLVCPMTLHESDILEHTRYHASWKWLHPVWENFRDMSEDKLYPSVVPLFEKTTRSVDYWEHCGKIRTAITDGTILEAFTALHSAIVWFNEINKQQ